MKGQVNREPIASMPLHQITAVYGETGLRFRLAHEVAAQLGREERTKVFRALKLADYLHQGDRRQDEPYINHPLRVALRIMSHYGVLETDVICAALLHDTVEDHADRLSAHGRGGALQILAKLFGTRVTALVAEVTNPVYDPGRDEHVQYVEHVVASLTASPWARVVKVSDFTDNAVGLHYTAGAKAARLARKYMPLIPVLRDLIDRPDTPLAGDIKNRIHDQLGRAADRCGQALSGGS